MHNIYINIMHQEVKKIIIPTLLDYSWAEHLIYKYEEEHDLTLRISDIESVLRKVMYEKDFECDEETFNDIIEQLIDNKL